MSGRQEYREFRPVELYDVAAVESWLEERDREGYHLLRFRGLYGIFYQDCSVAPSRYRLQPLLRKEKSPPPEMTDAYRELGWEYVCTLAGTFHIWRCGDPAAPELDTDPVVQSMGYGYLERKMRRHLLRLPHNILFVEVSYNRIGNDVKSKPCDRCDHAPAENVFLICTFIDLRNSMTRPTISPIHNFSTNVFGAPVI